MIRIEPILIVEAIQEYLNGKSSIESIANRLGVKKITLETWIDKYKVLGSEGFIHGKNRHYSKEFKQQVVTEYLSSPNKSLRKICGKYKIRSNKTLIDWIKKYKAFEELDSNRNGGIHIVTKKKQTLGRTTSFDERVEIVEYCIAHGLNYTETAGKFNISYQQARNYVIKYKENGVEGLEDRRGCSKPEEEKSEIEKLKAENKILRSEKRQVEMELSFLKKLKQLEGR